MSRRFCIRCALLLASVSFVAGDRVEAAAPRVPFPRHATYATGTLRPTVVSQRQQDDDVRAFYDAWKSQYVVTMPLTVPAQCRIAFGTMEPNYSRTVSEGQGYGVVIVALMAGHDPNARATFDSLWRFVVRHPSSIDDRLMGWEVPSSTGDLPDSAFDGDADIAYALLLADAQWGSNGPINYREAASRVIDRILESTIGPTTRLPLLGDWVDPNGVRYNQFTTRTSDFMYGHFRAYGREFHDTIWASVITATQSAATKLQTGYASTTGLLPDFVEPRKRSPYTPKPAGFNFLEGANDGYYYYNACRTLWRIGTDAVINGDATSKAQAKKMSLWIEKSARNDPNSIKAGYRLAGIVVGGGNYFTSAFAAPFGVAAMSSPAQQAWLNKLYISVRSRHEDYYEDSITLQCLLVMTGNFWDATLLP